MGPSDLPGLAGADTAASRILRHSLGAMAFFVTEFRNFPDPKVPDYCPKYPRFLYALVISIRRPLDRRLVVRRARQTLLRCIVGIHRQMSTQIDEAMTNRDWRPVTLNLIVR